MKKRLILLIVNPLGVSHPHERRAIAWDNLHRLFGSIETSLRRRYDDKTFD